MHFSPSEKFDNFIDLFDPIYFNKSIPYIKISLSSNLYNFWALQTIFSVFYNFAQFGRNILRTESFELGEIQNLIFNLIYLNNVWSKISFPNELIFLYSPKVESKYNFLKVWGLICNCYKTWDRGLQFIDFIFNNGGICWRHLW